MDEGRKYKLSQYPLSWPDGWARSKPYDRKNGHFKNQGSRLNIMGAIGRILEELAKMGIKRDDVLVSTNLLTRLDGFPRGDQGEPADKGVAVYWRKKQDAPMQCMAIDIYNRVADNLAAVAATLEALRAIERHGGAQVQERSFRGFAALPAKTGARPWRVVLMIGSGEALTRELIEKAFRDLSRVKHPDSPTGSHDAMTELNQARAEALAEVSQ
jgi:hypothetical protein